MKEIFIGNPDLFAIRYIPGYRIGNHYYARLHFVFHGQVIGDPEEDCFLFSWIERVNDISNILKNHSDNLRNPSFEGRTDAEIFEMVFKSNGIESPDYSYLPVLNDSVWANCNFSIDETTDAWAISMTANGDSLKFIWQGLRIPCPSELIGKLFSVIVGRNFVIQTIEECLSIVKSEYVEYPNSG
jgi:hypothetical protein